MGGKGSQYDLYNYFAWGVEAAGARLLDENATDRSSCIEQSRKRKIGGILFFTLFYIRGAICRIFRFPPSSIYEERFVVSLFFTLFYM
jgi:hypothetical protein